MALRRLVKAVSIFFCTFTIHSPPRYPTNVQPKKLLIYPLSRNNSAVTCVHLVYISCICSVHVLYSWIHKMYTRCTQDVHKLQYDYQVFPAGTQFYPSSWWFGSCREDGPDHYRTIEGEKLTCSTLRGAKWRNPYLIFAPQHSGLIRSNCLPRTDILWIWFNRLLLSWKIHKFRRLFNDYIYPWEVKSLMVRSNIAPV